MVGFFNLIRFFKASTLYLLPHSPTIQRENFHYFKLVGLVLPPTRVFDDPLFLGLLIDFIFIPARRELSIEVWIPKLFSYLAVSSLFFFCISSPQLIR
jgi:hypothetical protein